MASSPKSCFTEKLDDLSSNLRSNTAAKNGLGNELSDLGLFHAASSDQIMQ